MNIDTKAAVNGVDQPSPGSRCEIKALEERYDKKGELQLIERDHYNARSMNPHGDYALVTKQHFDSNHALTKTELFINSPYLLEVFKELVVFHPSNPSEFKDPLRLEDPFMMLYHYKEELAQYRSETTDDIKRMHLGLLLEYMDKEMGMAIAESDKMITRDFISYSLLWTIFKPGCLIYESLHGHGRLYRLLDTAYRESRTAGPYFDVDVTYLDYDGKNVGKAKTKLQMYDRERFAGKNPSQISSLPFFPRRFLQEDPSLEIRLLERGRRFLDLKGARVMHYSGLFEYVKMPPYTFWHWNMADMTGQWLPKTGVGRVVIDNKTFTEDFRAEQVQVQLSDVQKAFLTANGADAASLDDNPMLCPPFIHGFSLDSKDWCRFFVDQLTPISWMKDPMESLILPISQKTVLRALVGSHKFQEEARDEIEQKGLGLVILLHGTPGSGKTLTAETAAEYTHKALLRISLAEIQDQDLLEFNLRRYLRYATTWQAIVLIDEADVFLEARQSGLNQQSKENGLVAVFLRTLEYFSGIVFLTSNRVDVFDAAIISRLHLALQYFPPDLKMRRTLWRKRLIFIPTGERDFDVDQILDVVQEVDMNGREISNSINTARTLARDEKKKLEFAHLETIITVWKDFRTSLDSLRLTSST